MTALLCLLSALVGFVVGWAYSRREVAQARRLAFDLVHARHTADADLAQAIRRAEGAQ